MNMQQAKETLTDMLAGDVDPVALDEMEEFAANNAEFVQYRKALELAWGFAPESASVTQAPKMSDELAQAIKGEETSGCKVIQLSLDQLDQLAAAGQGVNLSDQNPEDKNL